MEKFQFTRINNFFCDIFEKNVPPYMLFEEENHEISKIKNSIIILNNNNVYKNRYTYLFLYSKHKYTNDVSSCTL